MSWRQSFIVGGCIHSEGECRLLVQAGKKVLTDDHSQHRHCTTVTMQSTGPHTWWQISYTRHWQYTNWSTLIITCSSVSAVIQYSLYLYELMLSEQCPGVWVPWSAMVGVTHVPLVWLTHCSSASLILTPETLLWSCTGPGTLRQLFISRLWKHFTNFDKCVWKMAPHNYLHSLWSQNIWTLHW